MNKILLWLTKKYIRFGGGRFERIQTYTLPNGKQTEICIFSKEDHFFAGQNVPLLNTIIIDEDLFERYSKTTIDFVVAHEFGHKKTNLIIKYVLMCIWVFIGLMFFGTSIAIISSILIAVFSLIVKGHTNFFPVINFIILGLILMLFFGLISWITETIAERYAIKMLGRAKYRLVLAETKRKRKKKPFHIRFIMRLTHPSDSLYAFIYLRKQNKK
jgi:Zn-dependent protease with chaperone function